MRTILIWCIIAGFLGGGALILRNQESVANRSQPTEWASLQFDPASVVMLELGEGDKRVRIERNPERIDEWRGVWNLDDTESEWAVTSTRVRGALRTLSTSRIRLSDAQLTDSGSSITLVSRDGSRLELIIGTDRSGGRVPVRLERRDESGAIERVLDGWAESSVFSAFDAPNTLAWRDTKLLDATLASVSRVEVSAGSFATSLMFNGTNWQIDQPFQMHADRGRVETLIRTMTSLQAERFIDSAIDLEESGLDAPIASIKLVSHDETYTLDIGQQADLSAETLYARYQHGEQQTLITIPTSSLSKLTAVPDAYVSPIANPNPQTSITGVRVLDREQRLRFESLREQGSWVSGGDRVDTLTQDSIARLVQLLTQSDANAVRVLASSEQMPRLIAGIELVDARGESLGTYDVAMEQSENGIRLLIAQQINDDGRVVWAYLGEDAQATATWLTLTAGRPIPSN